MILLHFILSVQAVAYQNWLCFDNAGHAQTTSDFSTALCTRNNSFLIFLKHCLSKKQRKTMISRTVLSIKNRMQVIPLSRNPRDTVKNRIHFVHFHWCSLFCSYVSFMFMFCSFCNVCSFLFISCIFCHWKTLPIHTTGMLTHYLVLLKHQFCKSLPGWSCMALTFDSHHGLRSER